MTEKEVLGVLAVLKAAYPNQLNKLDANDANGIVKLWEMQFKDIKGDIVLLAAQKHISNSQFFPTVADIKKNITSLHYQSLELLSQHNTFLNHGIGQKLSCDALKKVEYIYNNTGRNVIRDEIRLSTLIGLNENLNTLEFNKN